MLFFVLQKINTAFGALQGWAAVNKGLWCYEVGAFVEYTRWLAPCFYCGIWNTEYRNTKIRIVKYTRNEVDSFVEYTRWPGSLLWKCEVYFLFGELAKRKRARLQSPLTHSGWRRCYHNIVFPSSKTTRFHHHQFCIYLSSFDGALTKRRFLNLI